MPGKFFKWMRYIFFSIFSVIVGVYFPVLVIAAIAGETAYERVIPYCILGAILSLIFYASLEWYITKRSRKDTAARGAP